MHTYFSLYFPSVNVQDGDSLIQVGSPNLASGSLSKVYEIYSVQSLFAEH